MKKILSLLIAFLGVFMLCACNPTKEVENVITTTYYTITLPSEWEDKCIHEIIDQGNETYRLNIYEKTSYEKMDAGKLCSLILVSTQDNTYTDFPDYQLLASLDTSAGSYLIIALFPTDVQFDETTIENYTSMANQMMDVLNTISPVGEVKMTMY